MIRDEPSLKLSAFLNACPLGLNEKSTHTRLRGCQPNQFGGSFRITNTQEFNRLYGDFLSTGRVDRIVESLRGLEYAPVIADIDIKYTAASCERLITEEHRQSFVRFLIDSVVECVEIPEDLTEVRAYILQKKKASVISHDDNNHIVVKDGFHVIIPDLVAPITLQLYAHQRMVQSELLDQIFHGVPRSNSWSDVLDASVLKGNGFVLYGCSKPGGQVYDLTDIYRVDIRSKSLSRQIIPLPPLRDHVQTGCYRAEIWRTHDLSLRVTCRSPLVPLDDVSILCPKKISRVFTPKIRADVQPSEIDMSAYTKLIPPVSVLSKVIDLLSPKRATVRDEWIRVLWSLASCVTPSNFEEVYRIARQFSVRTTGDNCKPEQEFIHEWSDLVLGHAERAKTGEVYSFASILHWAKEDSPEEMKEIGPRALSETFIQSLMCIENTAEIPQENIRIYGSPYCKDLPLSFDSSREFLALQANMGTGKTESCSRFTQSLLSLIEECVPSRNARVLVISVRRSLTSDLKRRYRTAGIPMDSYMDLEIMNWSDINKLIISLESLYKVKDNPVYDIVVLDEVEAMYDQLHGKTVECNLQEVWDTLVRCCRFSTKVIAMDACLSTNTMGILMKIIGMDRKMYMDINTYQPLPRTFKLIGVDMVKKKEKMEHMAQLITNDILAGKKVVLGSSSLTAAEEIKKLVFENGRVRKMTEGKFRFYSSTGNDKQLAEDIASIQEVWSSLVFLVYTPTFTVGVSFDVKHFDKMYVWASPQSCNGMMLLQLAFRVRHLEDPVVRITVLVI